MGRTVLGLVLALIISLTSFETTVSAYQPDRTYTYDNDNEAVPSQNVYQTSLIVDEKVMGCTRLNNAQDIFVDSKDYVYILDSGNQRVVILNEEYRCVGEITEFTYKGETQMIAKGAKGIFYRESNQRIYLADTENNRILVSDLNGNIQKIYEKPVSELLDPERPYKPQKIVVDNMGIMYVTSGTVNTGALLIDSANHFLGFYGTNKIKQSAEVIAEYMWRRILTDEQNAQSETSFQPVEFNNIFWSEDRFVYAVSPTNDNVESPVVKLNALGNSVFVEGEGFGDLEAQNRSDTEDANPNFIDITVDQDGFFTIVDSVSNKLYQYDNECNLIAAFGGVGYQNGLFVSPVAIETNQAADILVLDAKKNIITVMEQTYYGKMVRQAISLYNSGLYTEAIAPWSEVIRMNANYYIAYKGIGKAYMSIGEYKKAMEYFELALDQENFSQAKAAYRESVIRENFSLIVFLVVVIMLLLLFQEFVTRRIKRVYQKIRGRKRGVMS